MFHVLPSRKLLDHTSLHSQASDSATYLALAKSIRFDFLFGINGSPTYFRGPGYSAFIALLWWDDLPLAGIYIAQAVIGALTALFTYKLARHFGEKVAVVSGVGMALAPMSIFTTTEIMTETVYTFLIVLGCYFWGKRNSYLSGIAFGLSWLVRPTTMVFLLFCLAVVFVIRRQRKQMILITLFAILTISPWIIRNAIVFHKFIPVAITGGGTNLLSGSLDFSFGKDVWAKWYSDPLMQTPYARESTETDKLFFSRAVERIKSDPVHWLKNRVKQYPWLFVDTGAYLHPANPALASTVKWLFVLGNGLALLLALWGMVQFRQELHVVLFPLFIILFHLPLWVEPRYSLPAIPMMIVLATVTVQAWGIRLQSSLRDRSSQTPLLPRYTQ